MKIRVHWWQLASFCCLATNNDIFILLSSVLFPADESKTTSTGMNKVRKMPLQSSYIQKGKEKIVYSWNVWNAFAFQVSFDENVIVCSPGLLTGKWLLFERSSLQWHDPPPTPLSKGPRLRLYLGCQPHSPHTYCTNKHDRIHCAHTLTL